MEQHQRDVLVNYRLERANDSLASARKLANDGDEFTAVNRAYYAMFYALSALALVCRFETSKHLQLIGWFNKTFVASGTVAPRFSKMLRDAFDARTRGDYADLVSFSSSDIRLLTEHGEQFLAEVLRLIQISKTPETGS